MIRDINIWFGDWNITKWHIQEPLHDLLEFYWIRSNQGPFEDGSTPEAYETMQAL